MPFKVLFFYILFGISICSAEMLVNLNIPWVILGHSERRLLLKESNEVKLCSLFCPCLLSSSRNDFILEA